MVVVIGAGISGLSCAWHLQQRGIPVVVLEAGSRVGGKIGTVAADGYRLELGPNTLYGHAGHLDLLERLGLTAAIRPAAAVVRHRFVLRGDRYEALPSGPLSFLTGSQFGARSKWLALTEPFRRNRPVREPETVAAFFRRRLGDEFVERAISPFVGGIFAGDPEELVAGLTLPVIHEAERQSGSIVRGMFARRKTFRRKATFTLNEGLQQLPEALAQGLDVRLDTPVQALERLETGWRVRTPAGELDADEVVLAVPADVAGQLLASHFPAIAANLANVTYAPVAVLHTAWPRSTVGHDLDGFGGLNPKVEKPFAAGSIWSGSLFPDRTPAGETLLTTFVGGMQFLDRYRHDDATLVALALEELRRLYRIQGEPTLCRLTRQEQAIPQYDSHALPLASAVSDLHEHGIRVCANWHGGVSVVDCLDKGQQVAVQCLLDYPPAS
ncbi:protoporphyrinogen oxidase [Laribacter hongkongensis]|uniref:Protoporphyrinogen oxidase n=1 Tax=Laribacter hongkongensis TaxID=168471 RepID=A0ABD4SQ39_9NEIS|nr:protoporphyrinogen oxidase [Laribacter hongkongensis]MCG9025629.1 protoporphyrinogen oxidase [Laribacter hongkongensis]MCG9097883.1 protoporphyrinogen oxidase [Laribacter hongkongensis]MCG9100104.1 protoporphyrinogen oxidase [Laribacter hongkongensis]MCG9102603.1 protoporphyrinogen oxidase [Laribacter hongkongensis]MCG9113834.1 protoporphyrinogen oxidase [Laribacter hongkongensis]